MMQKIIKLNINSCTRMIRGHKPRFQVIKFTSAGTEESRLMAFFTSISRVRYTIVDDPCSGLNSKNRVRFISHGAVDLCKVLRKTSKWLRLAYGLRYSRLIDELHHLVDSSLTVAIRVVLTTRGLVLPKGTDYFDVAIGKERLQ